VYDADRRQMVECFQRRFGLLPKEVVSTPNSVGVPDILCVDSLVAFLAQWLNVSVVSLFLWSFVGGVRRGETVK